MEEIIAKNPDWAAHRDHVLKLSVETADEAQAQEAPTSTQKGKGKAKDTGQQAAAPEKGRPTGTTATEQGAVDSHHLGYPW